MKTEHTIPSQLFLVAGKEVESALRRATLEDLSESRRVRSYISTWEDGKVVFINGWKVWSEMLIHPSSAASSGENRESLEAERDEIFLKLVLRKTLRVYIQDKVLHLEFPQQDKEFAFFLANPENDSILRNVCRDITGREMATQAVFTGTLRAPDRESYEDNDRWQWFNLIHLLHRMGDAALARRVDALRVSLEVKPASSPLDRPRVPGLFPAEGDDLTSQKGK